MAESDQLAERFRANHALLVAARDRLQSAVDAETATDADKKRLATIEELLTPVTVSELDADGNVIEVQRPRQFYSVDPDGQGRAVEVLGDLQQAQNVAVLVPGMGNSLDTFRGQSDRGDLIKQEAGPDTAVVVWLDYDSPQGLVEAASKDAAIEGGPRLAGFVTELDELKSEDAEVTLVAHSYGTDVAAQAVMAGARPKRLVMTGSPGIAKYVDEAADFVQPPTRGAATTRSRCTGTTSTTGRTARRCATSAAWSGAIWGTSPPRTPAGRPRPNSSSVRRGAVR